MILKITFLPNSREHFSNRLGGSHHWLKVLSATYEQHLLSCYQQLKSAFSYILLAVLVGIEEWENTFHFQCANISLLIYFTWKTMEKIKTFHARRNIKAVGILTRDTQDYLHWSLQKCWFFAFFKWFSVFTCPNIYLEIYLKISEMIIMVYIFWVQFTYWHVVVYWHLNGFWVPGVVDFFYCVLLSISPSRRKVNIH